jgi:hypothetical protein
MICFWGPALLVKAHALVSHRSGNPLSGRLQCDPVAYRPSAVITQQICWSSRWKTRSWTLVFCSIPWLVIQVSLLSSPTSPRLRWGRRSRDVSPIFDVSSAINRSQRRVSSTDSSRRWCKSSVVSCSWSCLLLGWQGSARCGES